FRSADVATSLRSKPYSRSAHPVRTISRKFLPDRFREGRPELFEFRSIFSPTIRGALKPARYSRDRAGVRVPSKLAHLRICPRAEHNFRRANFPAHQKVFRPCQNSRLLKARRL